MARGRARAAATLTPIRPDFEFTVLGPAISARAKNKGLLRAWTERVAVAASGAWPLGAAPFGFTVDVSITEFSEAATRDRDNMAKPILDAMQGIVYENDRQVVNLSAEWCDIEGSYIVRYMSPIVAAALSAGQEFLWIRIARGRPRETLVR